jgi:hypothetical protein
MKYWKVVILGLIVINVVVIDVLVAKLWKKPTNVIETTKYIYPTVQPITPTNLPTMIIEPTRTIITNKKTRTTAIVPIPGSGSTEENKWTDMSGTEFIFNTNDYPDLIGAYLEINMKLFNGNGMAYIRLFDVTAGVEVWGSQVETNNQNFTVVTSEKLTLRPGNHLYRIQAKSLTADTTVYNSGRIRIIYGQN